MFIFRYLRIKIFYTLMTPFSNLVRGARIRLFLKIMKPVKGTKILDLGGQPTIWDFVETHHDIRYVEGDACHLPDFKFGDFDLIFSNSVIEHVGNPEKQTQFANEVMRLSNNYWIQTPCKNFPIEAHSGMPFWWYYPSWVRTYFLNQWSKKLPDWTEMIATTTFIRKKDLRKMLPNAKILTEWFIFPKSFIAYSVSSKK
jgi:SAM-dependent methyltransferase